MVKVSHLIRELENIVGRDYVFYHPDELLVFEYDGSIEKAWPLAVVFPTSTEQVSKLVALAFREGIPAVGRGSGTGLSGGAITSLGGLQIVLTRMDKILQVDADNRLAVVEPGVINLELDIDVRKYGLRYAPDPSSQTACSLGGNVAENAGGPHCLAYGVTTNNVLGMEVVLEDGSVTWLGGCTREVPGYDLRGVFIGSEGTFAIATKIVVKLLPTPETVRTMLGIFPDVDSACTAVSSVIGNGIIPAAIEMIDALTMRAVERVTPSGFPDCAGAVLLIEIEGLQEEVDEISCSVEAMLWETGSTEVRLADNLGDRERLWKARKGALGALGSVAPNYYLVDGVVPRTRLADVLRSVGQISERHGLPIANVFHAGDGNLHPCILFDEREPGSVERAMEAGAEILKVCVDAGGTLTGEHGVGLEKKAYMHLVFTDEDMDTMKSVRKAFTPSNLFNPGKIFPGGPEYDRGIQSKAVASIGSDAYI